MVSAEGVIPRKPVHQHRRLVLQKAKYLRDHLLIATNHPVRVDNGFGHSGRTRGEKKLSHAIRLYLLVHSSYAGCRRCSQEVGKQGCLSALWSSARNHDFGIPADNCLDSAAIPLAVRGKYQTRREDAQRVAQPAEILGNQRIGRRKVRCRNSNVLSSQHEHQMLEIVLGENCYGALGREASVQQGLSHAFHCREHLCIGKSSPFPAHIPLSGANSFRKRLRPMDQTIRKNFRIRT